MTDVEEFLERAAQLMGKTYKRKDIMEINGIEIKPGMVLVGTNYSNKKVCLVAFPIKNGIAYSNVTEGGWTSNYTAIISDLLCIRKVSEGSFIYDGEILWEKPEEVVLTMNQIAEKFGVPVEQLKIKK